MKGILNMKKGTLKRFVPECINIIGIESAKEQGIPYIVHADTVTVSGEKFLRTVVCRTDAGTPEYCIFLSRKGFITWNYETGKWSESMIDKFSITGYEWVKTEGSYHERKIKRYTYDNQDSMNAGSLFFGGCDDTVSLIDSFQRSVRDAATEKRHEMQRKRIEAVMKQARSLPSHFFEWVDRVPLKKSRYIYYRRHGKTISGYCTVCKTDVAVDYARHNKQGICPHCHAHIIFKAEGLSKNILDSARVEYVQRIDKDKLMVRHLHISKSYKNYRIPEFAAFEEHRYVLSQDGKVQGFIENRNIDWLDDWKPYNLSFWFYACLYTPNLASVLKGTAWQYCAIGNYARHTENFSAVYYLKDYTKHPCLEYLSKLGLLRLIDERQGLSYNFDVRDIVNWNGKNVQEVLGISKKLLPYAIEKNVSEKQLAILQVFCKSDKTFTDSDFRWMDKNYYYSFNEDLSYFLKFMSVKRFISYVEKQRTRYNSISNTIHDWKDYIINANLLGYDLKSDSNLFPKYFKKAHDRVAKLAAAVKDKIFDRNIADMYSMLAEKYSYSWNGYFIRPPKCLKELVEEGSKLHHCVATYAQRVAAQETVILFIRDIKRPDVPLYTLEVRDGHVIQVRAFDDKNPSPEGFKFVEMWKLRKLRQPCRNAA
jgi:hypothetical protein